jgi:hypothetical protein
MAFSLDAMRVGRPVGGGSVPPARSRAARGLASVGEDEAEFDALAAWSRRWCADGVGAQELLERVDEVFARPARAWART